MYAPGLRYRFPKLDRLSLFLCGCAYRSNPVIQTMKEKASLFEFKDVFKEDSFKDRAMELRVLGTGSLVLDSKMIHPFVKIHIVDLNTCKYLAKQNPRAPGVYNKESATFIDKNENKTDAVVDYLLPMATQMCDLRIKGMNIAEWDEGFVINELASYLLRPNILVLFEILEFNPDLLMEKSRLLNDEKLLPIAWAYLRPLGTAAIHVSRCRLQLYQYRFSNDLDFRYQRDLDPRCPPVLLEFNWPKKKAYPSYLEIELRFSMKLERPFFVKRYSRAPWEVEIGKEKFTDLDKEKHGGKEGD